MDDIVGEDAHPWAFTVFLYPTFYYDQPNSDS
jgi:hypothetical protein